MVGWGGAFRGIWDGDNKAGYLGMDTTTKCSGVFAPTRYSTSPRVVIRPGPTSLPLRRDTAGRRLQHVASVESPLGRLWDLRQEQWARFGSAVLRPGQQRIYFASRRPARRRIKK